MKKLVVFDLDGTINKIEVFCLPAYRKVLPKYTLDIPSDEYIIGLMGETDDKLYSGVLKGVDAKTLERFRLDIVAAEAEAFKQNHAAYDGIPELLERLYSEGYLMAICTNARTSYAEMVSEGLGIARHMTEIRGAEGDDIKDITLRKILGRIEPDRAVMVGDRHHDYGAAKANGIKSIGCRYGYGKSEPEAADIKVNSPSEIYAAIKKLIG